MRIAIFTAAFLFVANALFATGGNSGENSAEETTTIHGKVIDKTNGDELTGVQVKIQGTDLVTYTDRYGNFTFEDLSCSDCQVQFSYISFEDLKLQVSELSNQEKVALTSR
ncbi:carboxypeptidase-like regulatory domain-containing protein [Halocola ammonii]